MNARKTFSWVAVVAWASLIFWLSSIPGLKSPFGWDFILRKGAHVTVFGVLTFLLIRAWTRSEEGWTLRRVIWTSAILALLYAISDEIHQAFVPRRGPSPVDVMIDSIGITLVSVLARRSENGGRWSFVRRWL